MGRVGTPTAGDRPVVRRKRPKPPRRPGLGELPPVPPGPFTTEGTISRLGEFAAGARRLTGWRGAGAKAFVVVFLLAPTLAGVAFLVVALVRGFLGG
jgi:hypothetical protein